MKIRIGCVIALCCLTAILAVAADPGLEGTWVTDGVAAYEAAKAGGKSLSNLPEAVTIKFKVDTKKNTISGNILQMVTGQEYEIKEGKLSDSKFTFNSVEAGKSGAKPVAWNGELKDPNTVALTRILASGQPAPNSLVLHRAKK